MGINLVERFAPYTDEIFKAESKTSLLTNTDFDWSGAHTVNIWKISTVGLNNYERVLGDDEDGSFSRFGKITDLSTQLQEMILQNDRSFIFNIDKLDENETAGQLEAGKALARELREVVIPEIDTYVYKTMTDNAGTKATTAVSAQTIYSDILKGSTTLDDAEVPDTERVLVVTPKTYAMLKSINVLDNTDIGAELKLNGVVATLDGMTVVKVPAVRLPENFAFMIAHPSATVAPVKLEDYAMHTDTIVSSGTIVTGRVCYDAFVLDNKKKAIFYHESASSED